MELTSRSVSGAAEYLFMFINNVVEYKILDERCLCYWIKASSFAKFRVGLDSLYTISSVPLLLIFLILLGIIFSGPLLDRTIFEEAGNSSISIGSSP